LTRRTLAIDFQVQKGKIQMFSSTSSTTIQLLTQEQIKNY